MTAADFTLRDQFDRAHAVRFADAPLTALVFSGPLAAADGAAWGRALAGALAGARVVGVAAVGGVPGFARGVVRAALAGQPPLPIDWGDEVALRFGYRAGRARAVLVDDAGRVLAAAEGPPTAEALAEFARAAEGARPPEARPPGPQRAPRA